MQTRELLLLCCLTVVFMIKAPNGPNRRSRGLDQSKLRLFRWSVVRPKDWTVQTTSSQNAIKIDNSLT